MNKKIVFLILSIFIIICLTLALFLILKNTKENKIILTNDLSGKIIDKIIEGNNLYTKKSAISVVSDIDNNGSDELIVCLASKDFDKADSYDDIQQAYFAIILPKDLDGNYYTIADYKFSHDKNILYEEGLWLGIPCVDGDVSDNNSILANILDINNDGKKEIVMNMGMLGVSDYLYKIFIVNKDNHTLEWLKIADKDGKTEDFSFSGGARAMNRSDFYFKDIDRNKTMEIIKNYEHLVGSPQEANVVEQNNGENLYWLNQPEAYGWNGSYYAYNQILSDSITPKLLQ